MVHIRLVFCLFLFFVCLCGLSADVVFSAGYGAGDGTRTHNTQLGKLVLYH